MSQRVIKGLKKCHVLFEWPLNVYGDQRNYFKNAGQWAKRLRKRDVASRLKSSFL